MLVEILEWSDEVDCLSRPCPCTLHPFSRHVLNRPKVGLHVLYSAIVSTLSALDFHVILSRQPSILKSQVFTHNWILEKLATTLHIKHITYLHGLGEDNILNLLLLVSEAIENLVFLQEYSYTSTE